MTPHPTVDRLLDALRSGNAEALRAVVLANTAELLTGMLPSSPTPDTLWGYPTAFGVCPVFIDTRLSHATANSKQFKFTADRSKSWHSQVCKNLLSPPKSDPTPQLDGVLLAPEVAQLCALLESGLIPFGSASDFGAEERKAACDHRLVWWTLQGPKSPVRPTNITTAVCEMFCGLPGYGVSLNNFLFFIL